MPQERIPDTSVPSTSPSVSTPFRNEKDGGDKKKRGALPLISGILVAVIGLVFLIGGAVGWFTVKSELEDENITVSEDADRFAGEDVAGPFTAYTQADTIKGHVLETTGGKTYAELEMDDPNRDTALQGATVRSALLTSTLSFGVSALAVGVGVGFILAGVALGAKGRRTS
jgi:hypothetical protein